MVTVARALALGAVVACASDSSPEVPIETAPSAEPDEELGQSTEPILIYNYSDSDGDSAATGGCLTRWNGGTSCTVANPPGAHWARDACASATTVTEYFATDVFGGACAAGACCSSYSSATRDCCALCRTGGASGKGRCGPSNTICTASGGQPVAADQCICDPLDQRDFADNGFDPGHAGCRATFGCNSLSCTTNYIDLFRDTCDSPTQLHELAAATQCGPGIADGTVDCNAWCLGQHRGTGKCNMHNIVCLSVPKSAGQCDCET
jgi:hypothetical protein